MYTSPLLRSTCVLFALLALLLLSPGPAQGEVYRLKDGSWVHAEPLGPEGDVLLVFTSKGKQLRLQRAGIAGVDSAKPLPKRLQKRLRRARKAFLKRHLRILRGLLKRWRTAKPQLRPALEVLLAAGPPGAQSELFEGALKDRRPALRALALRRLRVLPGREGVFPLVRAAITSRHKGLPLRAHQAAYALEPGLTRRTYEAIATSPTEPARRVKALGYLGSIGKRASVAPLIGVLEQVEMGIRAQLATGRLRRVNVNLGSRGRAAVNAPIELPEARLISVQAKMRVASLRKVAGRAAAVLQQITGQRHGAKAAPWRAWWSKAKPASEKAKAKQR